MRARSFLVALIAAEHVFGEYDDRGLPPPGLGSKLDSAESIVVDRYSECPGTPARAMRWNKYPPRALKRIEVSLLVIHMAGGSSCF